VIWTVFRRLATLLWLSTAASLLAALLVWKFVLPMVAGSSGTSSAIFALLVACYVAAGVIWALNRAYSTTVTFTSQLVSDCTAELFDAVVQPLLARCPVNDPQIDVGEARQALDEWLAREHQDTNEQRRPFSMFRAVQRMAIRRTTRQAHRLANGMLASLEQNGETHISVASLTGYFQERLAATLAEMARANGRAFQLASAAITLLLILMPIALAWLLAS
jgi:hypothetical protein